MARYLAPDGTVLDLRGKEIATSDWGQLKGRAFSKVRIALLARTNADDRAMSCLAGLPLQELDLFGTSVGDAGVAVLKTLKLKKLVLSGSRVTAKALPMLRTEAMEELALRDTAITDDTSSFLRTFIALRRLDLAMTKVGDRTLAALVDMPRLELVDVSGTTVTKETVNALQKSRPGLRIAFQIPSR